MSGTNNDGASVVAKAYEMLGKFVDEILVLRVTTVVGAVTANDAGETGAKTGITVAPEGQMVAHLSINTALGDTNVVLSKGMAEDAVLMEIHKQAIADALKMRQESVAMIGAAIKMVTDRMGT